MYSASDRRSPTLGCMWVLVDLHCLSPALVAHGYISHTILSNIIHTYFRPHNSIHVIRAVTAFLSAPSSAPIVPRYPVAAPGFVPSKNQVALPPLLRREAAKLSDLKNPLYNLKIENEKRKEIRDNIAHHRNIGSYRGLRHARGFPVRGQNTQTNAATAKKLNRVERRG